MRLDLCKVITLCGCVNLVKYLRRGFFFFFIWENMYFFYAWNFWLSYREVYLKLDFYEGWYALSLKYDIFPGRMLKDRPSELSYTFWGVCFCTHYVCVCSVHLLPLFAFFAGIEMFRFINVQSCAPEPENSRYAGSQMLFLSFTGVWVDKSTWQSSHVSI